MFNYAKIIREQSIASTTLLSKSTASPGYSEHKAMAPKKACQIIDTKKRAVKLELRIFKAKVGKL